MPLGASSFIFNTKNLSSTKQDLKRIGVFTNRIRSGGAKAGMSSEGGLDGWDAGGSTGVWIWREMTCD